MSAASVPIRAGGAYRPSTLVKPEGDFHANLNVDRLAILHRRIELPFLDCFNGLCIQPKPQTLNDMHVAGMAGRVYDQAQDAGALCLSLARFLGVDRIRRGNGLRSGNAAADVIYATTDAATCARADTGAVAYAQASAGTGANASAGAGTIRRGGRGHDRGRRHADVGHVVVRDANLRRDDYCRLD